MAKRKKVKVRRYNGQCGYGPWLAIDDPDVPTWVAEMLTDAIVNGTDYASNDQPLVIRGGSMWTWHAV